MDHVFDMTLSRADFLRILPALAGAPFREEAGWFRSADPDGPWAIRLTPLAPIALGALVLERQRVQLALAGLGAAAEAAFLARFWLHFQRGGG